MVDLAVSMARGCARAVSLQAQPAIHAASNINLTLLFDNIARNPTGAVHLPQQYWSIICAFLILATSLVNSCGRCRTTQPTSATLLQVFPCIEAT
jgi:hypothetical protein